MFRHDPPDQSPKVSKEATDGELRVALPGRGTSLENKDGSPQRRLCIGYKRQRESLLLKAVMIKRPNTESPWWSRGLQLTDSEGFVNNRITSPEL